MGLGLGLGACQHVAKPLLTAPVFPLGSSRLRASAHRVRVRVRVRVRIQGIWRRALGHPKDTPGWLREFCRIRVRVWVRVRWAPDLL